jgi:polyhydroxyalkanoate synthesis repressor PhaR
MLVKKYGNRRLYDTEDSRYVRLSELADKIRQGAEVRVVDAKTNDDLTSETLAQIIFEDRYGSRLLPVGLLHQMIRMGDDALAEFLGRYLTWALEMYLQTRQGFGMLGSLSPFSALAGFGSPFGAAPVRRTSTAKERRVPVSESPRDEELREMRRELDALKKAMAKKK